MQIGLIGLGKMGFNLALNMKDHGHQVVGYNRSPEAVQRAEAEGITGAYGIEDLVNKLQPRRVVWLMVPAGSPVDENIEKLVLLLEARDIIIDGGNSNYKDTLRRYKMLKEKGIDFVDVGTSGGIEGARSGACAMVGAEEEVFKYLEPLFKDICVDRGYLHTGPSGSGHFVKMVHNGVEYGMMQAIGEGFEVLQKSRFNFNLREIARVWNHGSVIRSWLIELAEKAFADDPNLNRIKGVIHSSGEGLWTVQEALELKVPVPVIAQSLYTRYRSEQEDSFSGKVVAALRNQFGGHAVEQK
ncbi:decarboxylating 6-phosphogluconate dehydrogenase [Desulfallas sp. Bu1-1]|jgi:6-phosphogluconate dehydrogenase|uniref:phosphogluconate dehydrogenase (NAD(+)-dependent, decarboxylating) n=1 Tax=Desulfallas sp. Bu1-1 TaxID=2787620 RepID=UPI00189F7D24|nr:decarboxylating 6-phosphogluconate dehydrogenase [Desulfallas sp. Bu1-1]MBF7083954.1 decarboxylating 6-phosphogluconate dehydrogenase [Desulfallas sp. Bu1-1]